MPETPLSPSTATVERGLAALRAAHDQDPKRRLRAGDEQAAERVWCDAVAGWVERLDPDASAALRRAAQAQHLERWRDPRSDWPSGRAGYLTWRKAQLRAHAARAADLLGEAGCTDAVIARVQQLVRKERLASDPEAATLEDAACLAFLELDLDDFARRHAREDVLRILARTWRKMSPAGRRAAASIAFSADSAELVRAATGEERDD